MTGRRMANPFYVALAAVGAVFSVTAFADALMVFRSLQSSAAGAALETDHTLWKFLISHGNTLLVGQVAALLALTAAAIGTDLWRTRSSTRRPPSAAGRDSDRSAGAEVSDPDVPQTRSPELVATGPLGRTHR
jgi:hypothetical protein